MKLWHNRVLILLGLLAMVPSNPNGNGENSTSMMGTSTTDAPQDAVVSSGMFYGLRPPFNYFAYTHLFKTIWNLKL